MKGFDLKVLLYLDPLCNDHAFMTRADAAPFPKPRSLHVVQKAVVQATLFSDIFLWFSPFYTDNQQFKLL